MSKTWRVEMPGPGDETLDLLLQTDTIFQQDGFGTIPHMYPVTIVQSRYNGTYEGGLGACKWLAFPVNPWKLNAEDSPWASWNDSDIECMEWWEAVSKKGVPIGRSGTPDGALNNLLEQVATAAGVELDSLIQLPTWDKDELGRRMDSEDD